MVSPALDTWPFSAFVAVLVLSLLADRVTYSGGDSPGVRYEAWTRYALLVLWWAMLGSSVWEYAVVDRQQAAVTAAGVVLVLAGTVLRAWGLWTLGQYFSAHVELKADHELVDDGPYAVVRHPAYTGNLAQTVGFPLVLNAYFTLALSLLLVVLFLYRLLSEERVLRESVPGYEEYVTRTDRLVPGVW